MCWQENIVRWSHAGGNDYTVECLQEGFIDHCMLAIRFVHHCVLAITFIQLCVLAKKTFERQKEVPEDDTVDVVRCLTKLEA